MTALALMGLVPTPGYVGGSIRFEGNELVDQPASAWRALRGDRQRAIFAESSGIAEIGDVFARRAEFQRMTLVDGGGPRLVSRRRDAVKRALQIGPDDIGVVFDFAHNPRAGLRFRIEKKQERLACG